MRLERAREVRRVMEAMTRGEVLSGPLIAFERLRAARG
jgi:hypothetical protein